ncbi:hypothetical protein VTP01DRAFT_9469 [Rhizomucor pusillus]
MVRLVFRPYAQFTIFRVPSLLLYLSPKGRMLLPSCDFIAFTFISRMGLPPKHSQQWWTPWSVFQDGPFRAIKPTIGSEGPRQTNAPPEASAKVSLDSKALSFPSNPETISRTFDSLFKVLFNFPSRYLFAIGLSPIFSFRRDLPPTLGCIPKQPDSWSMHRNRLFQDPLRDCHPL